VSGNGIRDYSQEKDSPFKPFLSALNLQQHLPPSFGKFLAPRPRGSGLFR
jgi:hypothetical protein